MAALAHAPQSTRAVPTAETSAPAVAAPTSARGSNTAAQERAGTLAPAPATASGLDATLDLLGETASVVLDALPLPVALPYALARRAEAWAGAWLRGQDERAVFEATRAGVSDAFDLLWPVGLGVELQGLLGGELGAGFVGQGALRAERLAEGLQVQLSGALTAEAARDWGAKATGAQDATLIGAEAEVKLSAIYGAELEWCIDVPELLAALVAARTGGVHSLLLGTADVELLHRPLERLLAGLTPTSVRLSRDAAGSVGAEMAGAPVGGALEGRIDGGVGMGADGEGPFVDAHLGHATEATGAHWLLRALAPFGIPADLGRQLAGDLRVRLRGATEALKERDLSAVAFEVTSTVVEGERTVVDTFRFEDAIELAAWLVTLVNPVVAALAEDLPPIAAEALPERTLSRSVTRELDAVDLTDLAPTAGAVLAELVAREVDRADALSDGSPVDVDQDARLEGRVAVPTEAVRAALGHGPLVPGPDGVEAAVLEVARAVATYLVGGSVYEVPDLTLDLDAAAQEVDVGAAELVVSVEAHVGAGGELAAGFGVGGKGSVGVGVSQRLALDTLAPDERTALLTGERTLGGKKG